MDLLKISHLVKSFGTKKVIDDLSLTVPRHSIFGFIGQNGAGKTTTMNMVLGLQKPDSGEIYVNGRKVSFGQNQTNRYIGYLPDVPEFYGFMKPEEYLMMCGKITGMTASLTCDTSKKLLALVGLEHCGKQIHSFSRGMKQRLGIAQALLNSPELLICDEPTSALDPAGRKEILDILHSVKEHTTVLFSTHILSDVERICDRIALLHNGKLTLDGSLRELRALKGGGRIEIEFFHPKAAETFAAQSDNTLRTGPASLLIQNQDREDIVKIIKHLSDAGIPIRKFELSEPTLEELFLEATNQ